MRVYIHSKRYINFRTTMSNNYEANIKDRKGYMQMFEVQIQESVLENHEFLGFKSIFSVYF